MHLRSSCKPKPSLSKKKMRYSRICCPEYSGKLQKEFYTYPRVLGILLQILNKKLTGTNTCQSGIGRHNEQLAW